MSAARRSLAVLPCWISLVCCAAPALAAPAAPAAPASAAPGSAASPASAAKPTVDRSQPDNVGFSTVPKVYVLMGGWAYNFKSALPNRPAHSGANVGTKGPGLMGAELIGDWLWQVGGFRSRWPSWVGFYLGWLHFPATDEGAQQTGILEYGLRIRHAFRATRAVRPFITYCLGATQVWIDGQAGRGITHQTRGGLGVDLSVARNLRLVVEAGWRMQSLPDLGSDRDFTFSSTSVNVGLLYERAAK